MKPAFLVGVLAIFAMTDLGFAKSLGEMTQEAEKDLRLVSGFLAVVFYLLGILLVAFGFFRVKKHMDQPQQVTLASAIVAICVGAAMIAVPSIINAIAETFGITGGGGISPPAT